MYKVVSRNINFEAEKNKKAFAYTLIICATLLLLFFFIRWTILPVSPPPPQDLIEINLGNNAEGFGEEQPLIKGEMAPAQEPAPQQQQAAAADNSPAQDLQPDDNAEADAAPVTKPEKKVTKPTTIPKENTVKPVKIKTPATVTTPVLPKPQKPKATYPSGANKGTGNGATENNDKFGQGNNPGGKGDAGDPSGKPDSYGNNPGGRTGGPKVTGNRKIIKYYAFTGDLGKETVNAIVKVSPAGIGTFAGFGKNSSTHAQAYANAIIQYLKNVQFDKSTEESTVTVQFNFTYGSN